MTTIEIARSFAALGQVYDALNAYTIALNEPGLSPYEELEAAYYIFLSNGDYRIAYTRFVQLYNRRIKPDELMEVIKQAFYIPNIKTQRNMYLHNCKLLKGYSYIFRKDFPDFEALLIKFFPFDDKGFIPFDEKAGRFGTYVNLSHPVVSRNFFKDLENPIFASDVYSQYELEYLNDNVRKSEWVARENHVYLHYSDWNTFCSYLQVIDLRKLLKSKKLIFLIEDESSLYPIDFKARFGIDYTQYNLKPLGVREINRLIWHVQFAAHNGGDFFNEVMDGHPNLIVLDSVMFESVSTAVDNIKLLIQKRDKEGLRAISEANHLDYMRLWFLCKLKDLSKKDVFVALYLFLESNNKTIDHASRITPALFFQPHFPNVTFEMKRLENDKTLLVSKEYEQIRNSPLFKQFKYIKTFAPVRRFTNSCAATVQFMYQMAEAKKDEEDTITFVSDVVSERVLNRSFMVDWQDRLYMDSRLVRFEDAKLSPKATFTALASFLDLPYTESMTKCTGPSASPLGFDTAAVYMTRDEYLNSSERYFLEYFLRDAYDFYGYDFLYYDGGLVDEDKVKELISEFTTINKFISKPLIEACHNGKVSIQTKDENLFSEEYKEKVYQAYIENKLSACNEKRLQIARALMGKIRFVNRKGQPLRFMERLELDPALLDQPLYH